MKKITTLTIALVISLAIFAQQVNLSMGVSYTNQTYVSLDTDIETQVNNNNWHIALSVYGQGAAGSAIWLNEVTTNAYNVNYTDTNGWVTLDTAMMNWELLLNSDSTWTNGAFNKYRNAANNYPLQQFDMGWGILDGLNNFWTLGDSLFVLNINGNYKKLWIKGLKSGIWNIEYANLDGSNPANLLLDKADYPNRNFIYIDMLNDLIIDREPVNTEWDLLFSKHKAIIPMVGLMNVTSCFTNRNVWSAKANEADLTLALAATVPQTSYSQDIRNLGWEWKKFSSANGGWTVYDSIAYFIYDEDSTNLYRIVFTDFTGMATGDLTYQKSEITTTSIMENGSIVGSVALYPNPANSVTNFIYTLKQAEPVTISIFDVKGSLVSSNELAASQGINQFQINSVRLDNGTYVIVLKGKELSVSKRLVVNK